MEVRKLILFDAACSHIKEARTVQFSVERYTLYIVDHIKDTPVGKYPLLTACHQKLLVLVPRWHSSISLL